MPRVTVDALAGISVDVDDHFNELRTLRLLSTGLLVLADNLKRREAAWEQQSARGVRLFVYGLDIDGTKGSLDLIACYFHWFGVSICNFARLVGFIRGLSVGDFCRADLSDPAKFQNVRSSVNAYVDGVPELTDMLMWRNKVAAHFAITDPRKADSVATLDMSVMFPVSFTDGRYYVGDLRLTRGSPAGCSTSAIPRWSVTSVCERLIPRYWPSVTTTSAQT